MANYRVHYRSNQTNRKRRKTVQAASEAEARKLIEPKATEIFEITFEPEPLATERQIQMLRSLGETPALGLTMLAASQRIQALLDEGREVDNAVFHENDPASERQLEYYRALGKKVTPEIQRLSYNQMNALIEKAKAAGAIANYDIIDREKPATSSQFDTLRRYGIEVTPEMEKMNKAEIKKIIRQEEERRRAIHDQERDARAKIHAQILKTLPTMDLSRVRYKTWADAARSFQKKFAKFGAGLSVDPNCSVDLYIEGEGTDEKDDGYCLTVDLMFEGYGPDKGLAYELSVAVHPHQENGFQFPLNAVPRSLPFPEGKYSTEQKYWAEFLKILTTDDQPSPQPMPARPQPVHPPKLEEVFSPLPDPEPPRKGWWRRLFNR